MSASRAYRRALPPAEALRRLLAAAGTQLDPRVVDALVETPPGRSHRPAGGASASSTSRPVGAPAW